jgi:hypothetical protein
MDVCVLGQSIPPRLGTLVELSSPKAPQPLPAPGIGPGAAWFGGRVQVWDDWPCDVQGPGPKLGISGTERPAAVKLRQGGTSTRCEARADKALSSAVVGRRSGMLWGSAMLA